MKTETEKTVDRLITILSIFAILSVIAIMLGY